MDLMQAVRVSASGMAAQSTRTKIIAENIANADSVQSSDGGPYRRQIVSFKSEVDRQTGLAKVKVHSIEPDFKTPLRLEYNPSSEYADANGFVQMPNVTSQIETADLREAGRAYEANITAIENAKQMMTRSLDLIR